jgi:hypothetical protein
VTFSDGVGIYVLPRGQIIETSLWKRQASDRFTYAHRHFKKSKALTATFTY